MKSNMDRPEETNEAKAEALVKASLKVAYGQLQHSRYSNTPAAMVAVGEEVWKLCGELLVEQGINVSGAKQASLFAACMEAVYEQMRKSLTLHMTLGPEICSLLNELLKEDDDE